MDPRVEILEVVLQVPPVVRPRHAVHPRCGLRPQREVRRPQAIDVDVMKQRGEPRILVLLCDSAHAIQRTLRTHTGSASGVRFADRVLLTQAASLPRLRRRNPGIVRRVRRYYQPVRLLMTVHLRRTVYAFPERPAQPSQPRAATRSPGSQHEEIAHVLGLSDPAGPVGHSRKRDQRCCLPRR
jgi:hypothetical protein